jgi:TetR/AcrR family transcriptional regulator, transcriptional repressor for nem operon
MVQKRSSRGRPQLFERDLALEEAMAVFWRRGFEAASIPELESSTGLNRSSLYNSFGSKRDLFGLALERYARMLAEMVIAPLENGERGLDDVHDFVATVRRLMAGPEASDGCLLVNSMIEFGGADHDVSRVTERHFTRLRAALEMALARAIAAGELANEPTTDKANALMGLIMGVLAAVRARLPGAQVEAFLGAAAALIDSWRSK